MTEFVGYYESHIGHYMPIIIIDYNDGNKEFKEMKKEDILRIPDDKNIPGTWLFKKGQSIRESWQKRYMIVRYLLQFTSIYFTFLSLVNLTWFDLIWFSFII